MERYPESEEHDRGFSRNRDYGRGHRGRSQHRDYDPEHAGFDRVGDRARARTGRMEDVPDGRWQHQPDSNRPEDYEWSRAGQPGQHYEGSYERSRSGPARTGYQRDDFDVHSYGRYQGRHQGGSGLGQVRGTAGGDREEASSGYGRAAMGGRNYARRDYERDRYAQSSESDPTYGRSDYNRGYSIEGGRDYDMDIGSGAQGAGDPSLHGPHVGRGPKGYQRSPDRIREDVCELLTRHGHIDATDVEVSVEGEEVTLRGTVDDRHAKRLADDLAASVRGVRDVHNRLYLRGRTPQETEAAEDES